MYQIFHKEGLNIFYITSDKFIFTTVLTYLNTKVSIWTLRHSVPTFATAVLLSSYY